MKDKAYPAAEAAFLLRQTLGTIRAWDDCLADMRRGKTTVCGFVLEPACKLHDGTTWRPAYAWEDIKAFVRSVHRATSNACVRLPAQGKMVEFDPSLSWKLQKIGHATTRTP